MVFVHGLGGDAFATWRHGEDDSTSWPHWLGQEFPEVGVWSLGYAAAPTKWTRPLGWFSGRSRDAGYSMALPDRALQVLDLMVLRGLGERPLFFICHSLGGLVAKQILRTSSDDTEGRLSGVIENTRAVLFLATPHAGAKLASLAHSFQTVFGTTVTIEDLRAHDADLRNLFNWYRNHAEPSGIRTITYFEQRPVSGVTIVDPTSSQPGVGDDPVGLDEDHLSIAKPRERGAQVCDAANNLVRNCLLAPRQAAAAAVSSPAVPLPPPAPSPPPSIIVNVDRSAPSQTAGRVPHELPPAAEEFFGRKAELERLTKRLRANKNSAVVGPAGLGKTALAAKAVLAVVGETAASLADSPFPDGVVFLDLYTFRGDAEQAWGALANKLAGAEFMQRSPARERATEACRNRRLLVIIEGGEEADGNDGRGDIGELLSVLSPPNRRLLLTRLSTQAAAAESVELREALDPADAERLLDSLTQGRVSEAVRSRVLELIEGHPLALTWAGNLLARGDDDPERVADEWEAEQLPGLSDPAAAEHTLQWLFERSVRGLDDNARLALAAAGLLARAPFPVAAIDAVLVDPGGRDEKPAREALASLVQRGLLRRSEEPDHREFTHVLGYRFARRESGSDPLTRLALGRRLRVDLGAALTSGALSDGPLTLTRSLEHLDALLRADNDPSLWGPLANFALYDMADRLTDLGRLPLVTLTLNGVAGWMERFPAEKAEEPAWRRERSVLLSQQGDVLRAQGDLAAALAAYRDALRLSRGLAEADPSNATWQRDLSVSHNKIGDVLRAQGDLAAALAAYRDALRLSRGLAEADPSNATWQRDLSWSLTRMAEFHERQGDRAKALPFAEESFRIDERLAKLDPSNATWRKDVEISGALVARLRG